MKRGLLVCGGNARGHLLQVMSHKLIEWESIGHKIALLSFGVIQSFESIAVGEQARASEDTQSGL